MTDTTTHSSSQDVGGVAATAKDEAANVATTAKGEAANVASTAKDEAANVASTAVDEAKHLGAEATDQAKQVLSDARRQLQATAQEQSQRLAGTLAEVGQQLRTMANAGDTGLARDLVSQAADHAHQVAQHLQQGGFERTVQDAKRLARNRPGTFLLGAAAAGFVAARVARLADTTALKEAAAPAQHGNGQQSLRDEPAPMLAGHAPTPPPVASAAAPLPHADRPLVADPAASQTKTATMPTVEERP